MFYRPSRDFIGNRSTRSFTDIFLKTLAISITTTAATGHLNSLRCISRKDRAEAIISVALFLILPTLPLTTLLYNIYHSFRCKGGDLSFRLGIVLGMRATPIRNEEGELSIPLSKLQFMSVQRVAKEYDLEWVGRMFVLIIFEVQAVATVVLMARRIIHKGQQTNKSAAASWDWFNGWAALGGAINGLVSIGILLLNYKWECFALGPREANGLVRVVQEQQHLPDSLPFIPDSMVPQMTLACSIITFTWIKFIFKAIKAIFAARGWMWFVGVSDAITYFIILLPFPLSSNFLRGFWRSFGFSLQDLRYVDKLKIGSTCLFTICALIIFVQRDVEFMRTYKANGSWMEIMWVDPLAEKLYVF